jgi:glutaredoxin 2
MVEYIIIELDILRDGDTAMYPVTAENPFDAVNKFYIMRKPPASDHIMVIPKVNIFEHCRNMTHTRRLHWKTEIDDKNDREKMGTKVGHEKSDDGPLVDRNRVR